MKENKLVKEIGSHKNIINALYLDYITETTADIITLDEDGIIKIFRANNTLTQIDISK